MHAIKKCTWRRVRSHRACDQAFWQGGSTSSCPATCCLPVRDLGWGRQHRVLQPSTSQIHVGSHTVPSVAPSREGGVEQSATPCLQVDCFVVLTDNETWAGDIHPVEALRQYRAKVGIPARLLVRLAASDGLDLTCCLGCRLGYTCCAPHVLICATWRARLTAQAPVYAGPGVRRERGLSSRPSRRHDAGRAGAGRGGAGGHAPVRAGRAVTGCYTPDHGPLAALGGGAAAHCPRCSSRHSWSCQLPEVIAPVRAGRAVTARRRRWRRDSGNGMQFGWIGVVADATR
jgi:hypothetical protein